MLEEGGGGGYAHALDRGTELTSNAILTWSKNNRIAWHRRADEKG
jgi:hypothetical protein